MADVTYDVLLAGQSECRCECGVTMWPGEVVYIDQSIHVGDTHVRMGRRFRCLHCAAKVGAPPIPVDVAARALREGAEHLKHAKMAGLRDRTIAYRVKVEGLRKARETIDESVRESVRKAIEERMSALASHDHGAA